MVRMSLPYFHDLSLAEWHTAAGELGLTPMQAKRFFRAVHGSDATAWSDVPAPERQKALVAAQFALPAWRPFVSRDLATDGTRKFLLGLADGRTVETVYIPEGDRGTLCVSSQVGCAMACTFCFTAKMGLHRHLHVHEILAQYTHVRRELGDLPITNIVFMGMGEPLHNLDHLLAALDVLTDDYGHGFPPRRITVSTSGLLPAMKVLLSRTTVRLALSVNGPNPEKRRRVMPVEKGYPILDILAYLRERSDRVGNHQQVMFEYVMLGGENDGLDDADDLIRMLDGLPGRVNLIPFNAHPGSPFQRPSDEAVLRFHARLRESGLHVFIRKSRGRDVLAACGQLHQEHEKRAVSIRRMDAVSQ